jgi:hypothetical protein
MSVGFHITTEGATTLQSAGGATLSSITVNTLGAGAVITLYDSATDTGAEIAVIEPSATGTLFYGVELEHGLTIVVANAACDITVTLGNELVVVQSSDSGDGVGGVLSLSYGGVGPFDVPVFGLPPGWSGSGNASMGAQITTGPGLVEGLQDSSGNPVPDGYTFSAAIFVEDSIIYDIIAFNSYAFGGTSGGIVWWGADGGVPLLALGTSDLVMPDIPTSDPAIAGAFYSLAGIVHVSAG